MSEFSVGYEPNNVIKAQALADFIQKMKVDKTPEKKWLMYIDESSTAGGSGGGIILVIPEDDQLEYATKFRFRASNNEVEYESLVKRMELVVKLGVRHLIAYSDSQLVSQSIGGTVRWEKNG